MAVKQQSGQQILDLLKQGYVRFKKEDDGNGLGSVEEVTGLSIADLKEYLKHPRLANIRVKVPTSIFIDDFESEETVEGVTEDFTPPVRTLAQAIQSIIAAERTAVVPTEVAQTVEQERAMILAAVRADDATQAAELEIILANATAEEDALFA